MLKKVFLGGMVGILISSILLAPVQVFAREYYLQYIGMQFVPYDETYTYDKYSGNGKLEHEGPGSGLYHVGVNIPQPQTGNYFLKSIHVHYYDQNATGYISVRLKRRNLWTNTIHTVAIWTGSASYDGGWDRANVATIDGYKFVETAKFSYYLEVYFSTDDTNGTMAIYQVRVHYGGP